VVVILIHSSQCYLAEAAFFAFVVVFVADARGCLAGGFLLVVWALTTASDDGFSAFCFGGRHISQ
jgi:hypothetical protein